MAERRMKKITTEIKIVEGMVHYEIFIDDIPHQGSYTFENWLYEIMKLKDELQFEMTI